LNIIFSENSLSHEIVTVEVEEVNSRGTTVHDHESVKIDMTAGSVNIVWVF